MRRWMTSGGPQGSSRLTVASERPIMGAAETPSERPSNSCTPYSSASLGRQDVEVANVGELARQRAVEGPQLRSCIEHAHALLQPAPRHRDVVIGWRLIGWRCRARAAR